MRTASIGLAIVLLFTGGCVREGGKAVPDPILTDLAHRVILPNYRSLADRASDLRKAASEYVSDPAPDRLVALRKAWSRARIAWGRCEAHFIGPEQDRVLQSKIDTFPIRRSKIDDLVAGEAPLTEAEVERQGADVKGLLALEYLIFGVDAARSARQRELIRALAENLERVAAGIRDGWEPGRGGHADAFAAPGGSGAAYPTKASAFDDLINRLVEFTEQVADKRLGIPMGLQRKRTATPDPAHIETRLSGHALADLAADLEGIRMLYEGKGDGMGLAERVARTNPELDRELRAVLHQAIQAVGDISPPLDRALTADPDAVREAFKKIKRLQYRIVVDLVAVYETTLMVVAFDGD